MQHLAADLPSVSLLLKCKLQCYPNSTFEENTLIKCLMKRCTGIPIKINEWKTNLPTKQITCLLLCAHDCNCCSWWLLLLQSIDEDCHVYGLYCDIYI